MGHNWRSEDDLISDVFYGPLDIDVQVLSDQQERIYICSVQTQDIIWRTYIEQWQ